MELNELLLNKEELPIRMDTFFFVPIHPRLLDPTIQLDPEIAQRVFPEATSEWYEDLKRYAESLEEGEEREWIENVFLKERPKIETEYGCQKARPLSWEDLTELDPNGFARVFSISRNHGGTLYFNRGGMGCKQFVGFGVKDESIKFPKTKLKEFGEPYSIGVVDGVMLDVYSQHNVDHFPGALFLRNWAILYMNEALKQVFSTPE